MRLPRERVLLPNYQKDLQACRYQGQGPQMKKKTPQAYNINHRKGVRLKRRKSYLFGYAPQQLNG